MIADLFTTIGSAITEFVKVIAAGFTSIMPIFYNATGEDKGFTLLGTLLVISAGVALVYWLFYFIRSLTHVNIK